MTFAAVGGLIQETNATFSLTPGGVGDLILFEVTVPPTSTVICSSMSSSNVTWTLLASFTAPVNQATAAVFAGKVTSTSPATVTLTFTGGTPGTIRAAGQEFSSTAGSWALDTHGNEDDSSATPDYPTLTPAGAGELYFCYAYNNGASTAGSTSGYVYDIDAHSNGLCYNVSCTSSAQTPVWGDSDTRIGIAVLMRETGTAPNVVHETGYYSTGRISANYGARVTNPTQGPPFYPKTRPVQAQGTLPRRGRVYASAPAPAAVIPPVHAGPPFSPAVQAIRARLPLQPLPRGRSASNAGAPARNPAAGPPVYAPHGPARSRTQPPFSKGRVRSSAGAPVQNPGTGPVFRQAVHAARAAIPQVFSKGRASGNPGAPVRNPSQGPVFVAAVRPSRAPVPQVFSKGRIASSAGAPLRNPSHGPAFRQATAPARARTPLPPRGRVASNAGGPVQNPPPVIIGPPFRQATSPARIRPSLPPRGRIASSAGAPVRNPSKGPVFLAAVRPVRAPVPQVFSKGRASGNPGIPAPAVAPVYPWHGPVRVHPVLPPRGRASGNPGIPVQAAPKPAPVYPLHGPVQARRPLPPHGRVITGNPGAPVRNPHQGAAFHSQPFPARTRIPQNAPRGRASGNPGGPVANIPFATLRFRTGTPYFQWATSDPGFQWATGDPEAG